MDALNHPPAADPASNRPASSTIGGQPIRWPEAERSAPQHASGHSSFVPLLLVTLALLAWSVFQTMVLLREADSLRAVAASQQQPVQESSRLRGALDGLARDMAKLADAGNASARQVVDELKKRGVRINAQSGAPAAAEK